MSVRKFSPLKAKKLHDQGLNLEQIAAKLGVHKSSVCRALQKLNVAIVAQTAVNCAPVYIGNLDEEIGHLYDLVDRVGRKLDHIETKGPDNGDENHIKWISEMRLLLSAISNTKYKAFRGVQVVELLKVIDWAVSHEPVEIQERIGERIKNRLGITISGQVD